MQATVNRWTGEKFARPGVLCEVCGQLATVVTLRTRWRPRLQLDVCGGCLTEAQAAIDRAVLDDAAGCGNQVAGD